MRKYFCLLLFFLLSETMFAQTATNNATVSKEQVISQMNYCINSITNVIHYKSMSLLDHEIDQLLNNLTIEQVVGLYEVQSFRTTMIEKISALQITEEEKEIMKRVQEMKRENLLFQSISNSLNPTLLLTGGGNNAKQLAFMAIVTAARAAVEYKSASNEADIEELQAMWRYRKADLENFADLRKDALDKVYILFQKYGLREKERLTEATSTLFSQIIAEDDPNTRIRKLLDNKSTFDVLADYYYYLGMAYVDARRFQEGERYLDRYLAMYQKAPIFRHDEKSGCVALSKLAMKDGLSYSEVSGLVTTAIDNLPNNGPAIIQCVLALNDIGAKERAFNLLRSGIDNDLVSDKDALVVLATELLPAIKKYPSYLNQITAAVKHCNGLNINSYIPFVANLSVEPAWDDINDAIQINRDGRIVVDSKFKADISSMYVQTELHKKNIVKIYPNALNYSNAIPMKTIKRKLKFLESNQAQIYIFFEPISGDEIFKVKPNLDYQKIIAGDYPGMSRPPIVEKDRKKIVKFCKKKAKRMEEGVSIVLKNKKGKSISSSVSYADYLAQSQDVQFIDYSNYCYDAPFDDSCKVKARDNVFNVYPPLKNYPKEVIRVILTGADTVQLCFDKQKGHPLYSITYNGREHFASPYLADMSGSSDERVAHNKVEEGPAKPNLFRRLWDSIFKKSTDEHEDVSLSDDKDFSRDMKTIRSRILGFFGIVVVSNDSDNDSISESSEDSKNMSNDKSWYKKLWDSVRFWEK